MCWNSLETGFLLRNFAELAGTLEWPFETLIGRL